MRTAVVRVLIDVEGVLPAQVYESGLRQLADLGLEVVATPADRLPPRNREIELIIDQALPAEVERCLTWCAEAFGTVATAGVVTYISRGTDDDARGVLDAFKVGGRVDRQEIEGAEVVTVVLDAGTARRVPESRLHTALEAALNCEVRIVTAG